jgi:hypothetical protein
MIVRPGQGGPRDADRGGAAGRPEATFDDVKRWALFRALRLDGGDKARAAARLGIALKTLYNWLNRWGVLEDVPAAARTEEPDGGERETVLADPGPDPRGAGG